MVDKKEKNLFHVRPPFVYFSFLVILLALVFVFDVPNFVSSYIKTDITSDAVKKECKFKERVQLYAPILMYHHVDDISYFSSYYVSTKIFDEQMKWLKDNKYTVISMDEFSDAIECGWDLPAKPVVLTFDDGDNDHYKNVLPILQKYGYSGTFYITVKWLGDKYHMTWDEVKAIRDAGMIIGGHTMLHPNVATLNEAGLDYEIEESRKILTEKLGVSIQYFAYPGGGYSNYVIDYLKEKGYSNAVTTHHAVFHDIKTSDAVFDLGRIHIDNEMPSFIRWIQGIGI